MEAVQSIVVSVELMEDAVTRCSHFHHEVYGNVLVAQMTSHNDHINLNFEIAYHEISIGVRPP